MWSKISLATLRLVFPAIRGSQCLRWRPRSEKCTQIPARNQTTHLDLIQQGPKLSNRRKDESFSYLPGNFPCSPSNKILCFFLGVVEAVRKVDWDKNTIQLLRITGTGLPFYIFCCYIQQENESLSISLSPLCKIQNDWVSCLSYQCWTAAAGLCDHIGALRNVNRLSKLECSRVTEAVMALCFL